MRILIVSKAFFPEISPRSFRTTELATELVRQGHAVHLAFPVQSAESRDYCEDSKIQLIDLGRPRWRQIEIKGRGITRLSRRVARRLCLQVFEYPNTEICKQIKKNLRDRHGFDLAITIAAPHAVHWGFASVYSRNEKLCKVWIADCGDPFMGVTLDTFPRAFYFKYFEKRFCRRADFITVPIAESMPAYYPEFHSKIRVIPQGFRFPSDNCLSHYKPNPVPTFAFAGAFIPKIRDPRPLLDYLCGNDRPFRFVCYTKQREMIEHYKQRLGDRLVIHDFAPRDELLRKLSAMDFLLNLENGTMLQSPSKLIDYALCRRPILSLDSMELEYEKIEEFLAGNYNRQYCVKNISDFNICRVADQFVELARQKM